VHLIKWHVGCIFWRRDNPILDCLWGKRLGEPFRGREVGVKFMIILLASVLIVLVFETTSLTSAGVRDIFKAATHAKE
jgi:hypothetical protein